MSIGHESTPRIRLSQPEDFSEIRAMVEASADGPSWSEEIWQGLAAAPERSGQQRISLVARDGRRDVVGWITGILVGDVADLEFLLISRDKRRAGLGRTLLNAWVHEAKAAGSSELFLEVRASNSAAIRLYRATGLQASGVRRAYYREPVEDAVVMHLAL